MKNLLNFMGKSLMVLVFSFLTLSVVLTSCSSDDSEVTQTNPDELLDDVFKATGSGTTIENFATTGSNFKIIDANEYNVTLDLNNLSIEKLHLVDETWIPDNTWISDNKFNTDTKFVSVNNNTDVGKYRITYRFTNSTRVEVTDFIVYYGNNDTFQATATIYQFNTSYLNNEIEQNEEEDGILNGSISTKTINNVPYQYLVGNRLYHLSVSSPSFGITGYAFSDTMGPSYWKVCKLSPTNINSNYLLPSDVINKPIRMKKYTNYTNTNYTKNFYELRVDNDWDTNTNYVEVTETDLPQNGTNDIVTFQLGQI